MTDSKAGDRVGGLSKRLFVLILAMVIAGFAIPSPGSGTPGPGYGDSSQYHRLEKPTRPDRLVVPSIKLDAPLIPIEIKPNKVLSPPADTSEVGWWKRSAKPGATSGQTLLTGHTVHTGGGVMNRLGDLRPGSLIQVETKAGTVDYAATKIFVYTKAELAAHADELFSQKRKDYRLVLVTCTGWTGSDYTSNIIVFADELGVRDADRADS